MIQRNKYVHRRTSIQAFTLQEILEVGETFVIQAYVEIKKNTFPLTLLWQYYFKMYMLSFYTIL